MRILLIDDERTIEGVTKVARTFDEGIRALLEGNWDLLYLDHDLSDFVGSDLVRKPEGKTEWTGYDVMCWLEQFSVHLPKSIVIVSSNPSGAQRIGLVIQKLYPNEPVKRWRPPAPNKR